jgi:putative FmdB family regulatory protein
VTLDLHTQGFLDALARIDKRKQMPIYDYKCNTCDLKMTLIRKITEPAPIPLCANCVKDLVRVYDAPGVTFKGTGWAGKENKK